MKYFYITLIACLLFLSFTTCVNKSKTHKTGVVSILDTFTGMYDFGFSPESADFGFTLSPEPLVIRDRESFLRFIDGIPQKEMTPVAPAPPNADPLLQRPQLDFEKRMLLVIFSHDPTRFIDLKIVGIELTQEKMKVFTHYIIPHPDEIVQKIVSYGFYHAALVDRFEGEIVFFK